MLFKLRSETPGRLSIGDGSTKASSRVDSDGRTTVQFHRSPESLAAWFKRCQEDNTGLMKRKVYTPRKGSGASFGEKGTTATRPSLNIAIHIVGSRGDVQPFVPIAQLLCKPPFNHRVRICTHPQFKEFVESKGLEFFSIGGDPEALMAYMVKNPGLLPSRESLKAGEIRKRRNEMSMIMHGTWRSCIEAGDGMGERIVASDVASGRDLFIADAIIANPPSMGHIHCAEKLSIPLHMVFTMPWSPTHTFHHPLAAMQYGEAETGVANYLSFMMMELLTWQGLGDIINNFRTHTLKLDPISPLWGHQLLSRLRVPYAYLWSPFLIPRPSDWGPHVMIAGFSFLSSQSSYTPPADLVEFLGGGPPPVYVGFGSIVVDDPQALTQLVFKALELANVRGIVSKGWGGLGVGDTNPNIYLIGDIPHDWLFQHVSCIVHHGGAGTTAAGLAAGVPTVVIPFFGDQPFWGAMVSRAGAGPDPVPYKKITAEILAEKILFALQPEILVAAQKIATQMADEDGASNAARDIQERLDSDDLRCDICPNRLAILEHKKTGAHLSTFAAYCLLNRGIIKIRHLEMLRHKHWYVDEGAESALIGLLAAFSGFFTDVGVATSHYVSCLKSQRVSGSRRRSSTKQIPTNLPDGHYPPQAQSFDQPERLTPKQLGRIARSMAKKLPEDMDEVAGWQRLIEVETKNMFPTRGQGNVQNACRATGRYAVDLTRAGLKAPVALFYNLANGSRNFTSYAFDDDNIRRRDEVMGLKSGFKVAGKEFALGFYEGFGGLVLRPYRGAKREGIKGFGKGLAGAYFGLLGGIGSGIFGLPGYTLKGIEKELSKHRLTELRAEILLIRIRQGLEDYCEATDAEKRELVERWKLLYGDETSEPSKPPT